MDNREQAAKDHSTPASKLEAVRDLIFGQELQELDERLNHLAEDISQRDQAIHQDIKVLEHQMSQNIAQMQRNILNKISEVQQAAEQEIQRQHAAHISKKELGQILGSIANQLDRA